jgi:hypothetical protein
MAYELATFNGWTVDARLREFRQVCIDQQGNPRMETVRFESESGQALLDALVDVATAAQTYTEESAYGSWSAEDSRAYADDPAYRAVRADE